MHSVSQNTVEDSPLVALLADVGVRYGDPNSFSGLTLIPVFHTRRAPFGYTLLAQATAAGTAVVEEVGGGTVPTLRLRNNGAQPVLLVDGEHLVGVKQNRILNTTLLVPEKSTLDIPVACVEAGRWGMPHGNARPISPLLFMATRALKNKAVTTSVRASGRYAADQGGIWNAVGEKLSALGVDAPTEAMHEAYERRAPDFAQYLKRLPWQTGQAGVVAAVGGRIACADLFDRPETLQALWDRLIPSYAVEAMTLRAEARKIATATAGEAAAFLRGALTAGRTRHPAVGRGTDLRLTGRGLVGAALEVEDALLHLALFRAEDEGQEMSTTQFASVQERRRRKTGH